jgi:cell division protein FtsI (penicillin-binding protein 3)/stage V sporulation protein D (sporulation-specific penicillin-binding protein)
VARRLSDEEAKKVRALKLLGVQTYREQWRYYQGGTLASHALGFVGFDETSKQPIGMYGLERYWDTTLSRANDRSYVNFFAEIFAPRDEKKVVHEKNGDIVTTIEPTVQAELERTLASARAEWHAKELGGVVINPKTGAVYALAALPDFNPNEYAKVEDQHVFVNPLVENVYEMGSIIKPLAMAIGLDTKAVTPETSYHDTGKITIDGYTIGNYDGRARGNVSMQEVLNQSLNVGMAFVTQQVGGKVMGDRLRALGLGEETGIDLPFEARGLLNNLNNNREVEYITASFGQGIALTPIQTVRALCALGNGGVLPSPHLVEHIIADDGDDADITPNDTTRVFSQETSEEITRMLVHVVDTSLRNGTVKREHYAVAAKTGTAQIAKKGERGYYDDRYLHSFFGYFPAYNPQFLIFLYHVEPQGAKYASETLTTPFMNLTDFLIRYYNLPPDR